MTTSKTTSQAQTSGLDRSSAEAREGLDEMSRKQKPTTIIRAPKDKENPYKAMRRATFEDRRLSWEERGILGYLLVKRDDWEIDASDLWHAGNVGRDKIYKMLAHLEKVGYLEREIIRERGQFARIRYLLHEEPLPENQEMVGELPLPENQETVDDEPFPEIQDTVDAEPLPENQEMATRVTPFPGLPDTVNQERNNKEEISNKEQSTKEEELGIVGVPPTPPLVSAEWQAYLEALCWVCHGHQKTDALTEVQLGALTAEAKKIRDAGYSKDELRDWWKQVWRNDWRWDKGRQRPRPDEVRSSIPILRAGDEADDAGANGSYLPANYEPLQMTRLQEMAAERDQVQLARRQLVEQRHAPGAELLAFWETVQTDVRLTMTPDHYRLIAEASVLWMDEQNVAVAIWDQEIYRELLHPNRVKALARTMSTLAKRKLNLQIEFLDAEAAAEYAAKQAKEAQP